MSERYIVDFAKAEDNNWYWHPMVRDDRWYVESVENEPLLRRIRDGGPGGPVVRSYVVAEEMSPCFRSRNACERWILGYELEGFFAPTRHLRVIDGDGFVPSCSTFLEPLEEEV